MNSMHGLNGMNAKPVTSAASVMHTLLAKDLRLSLDSLLPWGLIVVGFAVIAAAICRLPESIVPAVMAELSIADILFSVAFLVAGTALAVGAWTAAAVAQGDRIHGAEHLMIALPVAPMRRVGSKLSALVVGAAIPALVSIASIVGSVALSERVDIATADLWRFAGATTGASFIGAALGLGVSPIVRGPFRVVFIALLLGLLGGLAGCFAWRLSIDRAASGFEEFQRSHWGPRWGGDDAIDNSRYFAAFVATIAGVATTGLVALLVGAFSLVRPRRPMRILMALAVGVAMAFVAGAAATFVSFGSDARTSRSIEWMRWRTSQVGDEDLVRWMSVAGPAMRSGSPLSLENPLNGGAVDEIRERLNRIDPASRPEHPLMRAALAFQGNDTEELARRTVSVLPSGPEAVERAVDAALRYPRQRQAMLGRLVVIGRQVEGRNGAWAIPEGVDRAEVNRMFDEAAEETLRSLQLRYPAQRPAIQALLDEMSADAVQPPEGPAGP